MATSRLEEIRNIRLEKLKKLQNLGIDPFPAKFSTATVSISTALTSMGANLSIAGRLTNWREHGNIIFADLQDASGKLQLLFQKNKLGDQFKILKLIDSGDFLGASGEVITTQAGEITLDVSSFTLLTKTLRPLPESWDGLEDMEERYRRRYVDLAINPEAKAMFFRKSKFWAANRKFLNDRGFIEVETPILEHITGGADAQPFVTHHNALDQNFYLRISTELYLKRLVGGGFDKVYTIGPNFRNEGIDDEHLPEYYQVEWYWAYANYRDNMTMLIEMFRYIAKEVYGRTKFTKGDHTFDLADEWTEIDYHQTIKDKLGIDIFASSDDQMFQIVKKHGVKLDGAINRARLIDNLWKLVRKSISGPAFLVNEPKFMSPLAKSKPENPELTERFHIIIAGSELGNGYSELNDPIDQLERFREQQTARDAGDAEAQMLDIDFVEMLEYGMPPTSGYAHSERLFWFLEGVSGKEATLFPQLRYKVSDLSKKIYGLSDPKPSSAKSVKRPSRYEIATDVKETFPGISFAYTIIKGVKITKTDPELEQLKSEVVASKKGQTLDEIQALKPIASYRQMLKATKVDFHSRHPSPEALLRRLAQGKNLYTINTAVDAYNLAVIETGIGLGGFDLAHVAQPVLLRFSKEGEQLHLLGDDKPTLTKSGELVYSDADKLLTLDLNYRDIDATKITDKTTDIILFADGGPGISEGEVVAALEKGANYIVQFAGGTIGDIVLIN